MKKLTLVVLALGLTFGAFAQKGANREIVPNTIKQANTFANNHNTKAGDIYYPNAFSSCATLDSITYYTTQVTSNGTTYNMPVTGSGLMGGIAVDYTFTSAKQITGVVVYATKYIDGDVSTPTINIMDQAMTNTLGSTTYSTASIDTTSFTAVTANLSSPVSSSAFTIAVNFPELSATSSWLIVGTTSVECSDNLNLRLYYDSAWVAGNDLFTNGFDPDPFIFPILSGVGLNDVDLNTITYVYPNPAKEQVLLGSSINMNRVEICNMLGQVVYSANVSGNATTVNTSNYAKGNYIVKMYTDNGIATKKLVVE
jgi:hypothetical protein